MWLTLCATTTNAAICIDGGTGHWIECPCPDTELGRPRTIAATNTDAACAVLSEDQFAARVTQEDPALDAIAEQFTQADGIPVGVYTNNGVVEVITALWSSETTPSLIRRSNVTHGATTFNDVPVSSETAALAANGPYVPVLSRDIEGPCAAAAVTGLLSSLVLGCAIPVNGSHTELFADTQSLGVVPHTDVVALWGTIKTPRYAVVLAAMVPIATVYTLGSDNGGVQLNAAGITAVGPTSEPGRIIGTTDTDVHIFDAATGAVIETKAWTVGARTPNPAATTIEVETLGCALPGSPCSADLVCCDRTLPVYRKVVPATPTLSPYVPVLPSQLGQPLPLLPREPVVFFGKDGADTMSDNAPDSVAVPVPPSPPPVMGRRAMGFNQPGGDERFKDLMANCDVSQCTDCDQSRIAGADSTPLPFEDRHSTVRGQTADKSVLGTFYRDGAVNEYSWLVTRNGTWAVDASFAGDTRRHIWGGATYDPTNKTAAFWNRWYADQTTASGTPLWPTSAKSDFGLCCAYLFAGYGTNGYRPPAPTATTRTPGLKTTSGLEAESAHNAGQEAWGDLAQFPPFPQDPVFLGQCYTGGLDLTAEPTADQKAQACETTFNQTLRPVGCRQPFTADDWMTDDEKKIVALHYPDGYNQADFLTAALWPAEGCMTDYDCELPQLAVLQPSNCTTDISKSNCKLCTNVTNATVPKTNCMPPRSTLAEYNLPLEKAVTCPPDTEVYECGGPTCSDGDSVSTCHWHICKRTERQAPCSSTSYCKQITTNFQGGDDIVGFCDYEGILSDDAEPTVDCTNQKDYPTYRYECEVPGGDIYRVPFVFGVPDGTGGFTVPGIKDGKSPFLQRRAYAQCIACSDEGEGKCCKADSYREWHSQSVERRNAALNRIYSRTTAILKPAKTTRQYPFVWGGTGPEVEGGYPYHPPIFPDNDFVNKTKGCETVKDAAPVGCADNVANIALRKDSTVARRTIIKPAVATSWDAVTDKTMAENTYGCPTASVITDMSACTADNPRDSMLYNVDVPYGCYSIPIQPLMSDGRLLGTAVQVSNTDRVNRINVFNVNSASVLKNITTSFVPVCYTRSGPIAVRRGFMSCPPTFDVLQDRCQASTAGNYSTPIGCYEDLTSGTRYYSYGAGTNPIPRAVSAVCYGPTDPIETVVQCQGPGAETLGLNTSFAGVDFMGCDDPDPTDWRCRFQCT